MERVPWMKMQVMESLVLVLPLTTYLCGFRVIIDCFRTSVSCSDINYDNKTKPFEINSVDWKVNQISRKNKHCRRYYHRFQSNRVSEVIQLYIVLYMSMYTHTHMYINIYRVNSSLSYVSYSALSGSQFSSFPSCFESF